MEPIRKHPEGDLEKSSSSKNIESRVVCLSCTGDNEKNRNGNGDSLYWDVTCHTTTDDKQLQEKSKKKRKSRSPKCAMKTSDFASGDHETSMTKPKYRPSKSVDFINLDETDKIKEPDLSSYGLKTIHEYKNPNYCESESDSLELMSCPSLPKIDFEDESNIYNKNFPRPIICPVLVCGRMIAMDSVLLHFFYDHSKILRKSINIGTPERTLIKPSSITENTQCLAIFLLRNMKSEQAIADELSKKHKDCYPLFLMAARIPSPAKSIHRAGISPLLRQATILQNASTQTDYLVHNSCRSCVSYSSLHIDKSSERNTVLANESFGKDETLILWLCKIDSGMPRCHISAIKEDQKHGYSYIGEPIHIRDKQDSSSILDRAECLIIPGVAANRLVEDSGEITILVSVLNYLHHYIK